MKSENNYKIYQIVNCVDDTLFIGATTGDLKERLKKYIGASNKGQMTIHKHIRELGSNNFSILLLEETNDITRKDAWIFALNTLCPNGLNRVAGKYNTKVDPLDVAVAIEDANVARMKLRKNNQTLLRKTSILFDSWIAKSNFYF